MGGLAFPAEIPAPPKIQKSQNPKIQKSKNPKNQQNTRSTQTGSTKTGYQVINAHEAQRTMELEVLVENCATELRELRERVNVLEAALQRATCPQRPEEARQSAHRFPGYRVDHGGTAYRPGRWREGNSWRIRNPDGHISVFL